MKKLSIIILLFSVAFNLSAQIHGMVMEKDGTPIPGVNVHWKNKDTKTITDMDGNFSIPIIENADELIFTNVAYVTTSLKPDKTNTKMIHVIMNDSIGLAEVTVHSRSIGKIKSRTAVFNVETLNTHELSRAACCNLSESFETNASVDVSYEDAATGAKQIKLLGLSGIYVQMLTENIPSLHGLSSSYGMGFIPGPWMESIQISKGTASVKNGYESIAGQINVEYKKPKKAEPLMLNLYTNSAGRIETNATAAVELNQNLSTAILAHYSDEVMKLDANKDNYMDLPMVNQYNLANRWHYEKDGYIMQAFLRGLKEKRTGGQVDGNYHIGIDTERYEFFLKNGFVFGDENHKEGTPESEHNHNNYSSLGVIVSGIINDQDAVYGVKEYNGKQNTIYANVIYDRSFSKMHKLSLGSSFNADLYKENLKTNTSSDFNRNEYVPGAFAEYTLNYKNLVAVAGLRADYNSLFGTLLTPRIHVRYAFKEFAHLRLSAGKGYRAPNILAENNYYLASNRSMILNYDKRMPEEAWNYGATLHTFIPMFGKELNLMTEWFYTDFKKQVVTDLDTDPHKVIFDNLNGKSFSSILQVEANMEVFRGMNLTIAHRINNVKTTYNGVLREKPLTNRTKSLISGSYQTKLKKWQFDLTAQINGGGRLPDPDAANPLWEKEFKPFTILNGQISKYFKTWSVYAGAENITNFTQKTPIIEVNNPFGNNFDATMLWAPMHGRTLYLGLRWQLDKMKKKI